MPEFNEFPQLPSLVDTDEILVVRGGTGYRGTIGQLPGRIQWANFQIRKPIGENGGVFTPPNQWLERSFNYASPNNEFGTITITPTPGRLTLPAGDYRVTGWLIGMEVGGMRCQIRPLVGEPVLLSASIYSRHYSLPIPISGLFSVEQTTTFITEMWCDFNRSKSWGYGYRTKVAPEIYGSLMISRRR